MNIGKYAHFSDKYRDLPLDYFVLPENLEKAKKQFAQVPEMLEAYEHYFGEYPFQKDGYKLIEVPYAGMEHQSAVAYGNRFENGYYGRDWTGAGISLKFDFIIIHESGHEWFGNSVTAADRSDMWIHEGWTTYMELLYVERLWGHDDAIKYANGLKPKVKNDAPVITARDTGTEPSQDQYFKGALFINTLRSVINDDKKWFKIIRNFYQRFKYQTIMTENVVAFFNEQTKANLTPIFNQYLRHTAIPLLELKFDKKRGAVAYRWKTDEPGFAMPVRVGSKSQWQIIQPTAKWQEMKTSLSKDDFEADTDLYYVNVSKQ
jgi:aminopeptidase N